METKVHFLISYNEGYMASLHYRACDSNIPRVTRYRNKKRGSFKRRYVNCGNCERTNVFLKA